MDSTRVYDICVIGSGPAGGVLAKELAEHGAKVALVEAGRQIPVVEYQTHRWPYELPNRSAPMPGYLPEVMDAVTFEDSDSIFVDRIRAVGGRSIHWNAVCLRFAERDFREKTTSGTEEDWPLSYQDLAPDYTYVEKMIGVTGSVEHLDILPDGDFLPPLNLRCGEHLVKRACARMGIPFIPTRKALVTRPYDSRPACHYCGHCMRGCDVGAIFSTAVSMLPKAQKTGNFTLIPTKLVREILVDREGRARAAAIIDTVTRQEGEVRARVFAVCGGAIETPRVLLNSRSPRFPNGLANSSGLVGRYLTGHSGASLYAYLEDLVGTKPVNNDGALDHGLIPRFNHLGAGSLDYVGGWHYQTSIDSFMFPHHAHLLNGFGSRFKEQVRYLQPGFFQMSSICKVMARRENYVTVNPERPDIYGVATPLIHFRFCDNDRNLLKDSVVRGREILNAAKPRKLFTPDESIGGFAGHEAGTTRMGNDPRTSVLNSYCQSHDVKNLFAISAGAFPSLPEKNPTHTVMALAIRAARYIMSEAKNGSLRGSVI